MPRPKTISDEDVLAAALEVLAEKGADFTLSDLALQIGLARATLIQRFGDRDAIILRIATYEAEVTRNWLAGLPVEVGWDGVWRFLEAIVGGMGDGEGFSARVTLAALEARHAGLRELAYQRYALVQDAIAARLPDVPERARIAQHLHTVIAGASMHWIVTDRSIGLSEFILERLRWTLGRVRYG
ncbi:TetR/AcrR family transcriptional regulator [Roseococcus sp. YIM B11640]|uniref:TetR/AcrR family transcriptional regulator n=1 Tax=Roseococcus sp. YIM B11640 TaxID=3133973 RepID=UPI003C7A7743